MDVAKHLGINKMAASRRIATAEEGGWLVNKEAGKKTNVKDLVIGEPLPSEVGLPTPEGLAACTIVTEDTGKLEPHPAVGQQPVCTYAETQQIGMSNDEGSNLRRPGNNGLDGCDDFDDFDDADDIPF